MELIPTNKRHNYPIFGQFEIETSSYCNLRCPSCIRNSEPDRTKVEDWFHQQYMPLEVIRDLFSQLLDMDFRGVVNLQHFNEPLLDPRFVEIAEIARRALPTNFITFCTNADYLTEDKARALDGLVNQIFVSFYCPPEEQRLREAKTQPWFSKTQLVFTDGYHVPTHNSGTFDTAALARKYRDQPCMEPGRRLIINHKGECLGCCADLSGHFGLGNVRDYSLADLWWSLPHQTMINRLQHPGGRNYYARCITCPQPCWPQELQKGSMEELGLRVKIEGNAKKPD